MSNWDSFVKRLSGAAKNVLRNNASSGLAIVSVSLLVDSSGEVIVWAEPSTTRIEPSREAVNTLISIMIFNHG